MEKLKLSKPFLLDGNNVTEIEFDLEEITGVSISNAYRNVTADRHVITMQESDPVLHAAIFAEAANMDYGDVKRLPAKDFMLVGRFVRNFLYSVSAAPQATETSEES
jgi:hypothetical protein